MSEINPLKPSFSKKVKSLADILAENDKITSTDPTVSIQSTKSKSEPIKFAPPSEAKERLRIIFDDSGSMEGAKIKNAREGCIEFMRNCVPNETACAVHPMNYIARDLHTLTTNLPALSILINDIKESGSTPLFRTLDKAQALSPKATRYIVFSDGAPNYSDPEEYKERCINKALEEKTPIDAVLIVKHSDDYTSSSSEYKLLKELADRTGGYFILLDSMKVNFKDVFKYLAPTKRGMLASSEVRLALEAGKLK